MFFSRALNDINQGHELLLPVLVERRNKFDNQEKDPASGPSASLVFNMAETLDLNCCRFPRTISTVLWKLRYYVVKA